MNPHKFVLFVCPRVSGIYDLISFNVKMFRYNWSEHFKNLVSLLVTFKKGEEHLLKIHRVH